MLAIRYLLVFFTLISSFFLVFFLNSTSSSAETTTSISYNFNSADTDVYVPEPDHALFTKAEENLAIYRQEQTAEAQRQKLIKEKVDRTIAYLQRVGSPVANEQIATILVEKAEENNADYRVLIAIMMIESGACRQSFAHNCFGYLNGARYSSYEQAFNDLVPKVSRQYAARYGWDFVSLSRAYGQHNWQLHSANMLRVASSV